MLNIQNLTYLQNGLPLLQEVNLQVFANQRVGLVGRNGCGKSTLFRLIRGEIHPDKGGIILQAGKTIAFVEQEIISSHQSALEFVLDGDVELRQLEQTLVREVHDSGWFEAQQRYEAIDGYGARARAAQLLNGLGFANDALERAVNQFSGGWRMRLNLARALMHRADLLLLDEPTNHLDLEAILWLEQYLTRYPGSLIVVSHDREFLNTCVNRIAHIHNRIIDSYGGNYDDFERTRAERIAQQTQAFQQQQRYIAHMEDFVRRFRAKATKAKQAQSRIKALERLARIVPLHVDDGHYQLQLNAPEQGPDVLLKVEDMGFGYGGQMLFQHVNLFLRAGMRIALMGPNGAGKSTLIKLLTAELKSSVGRVEIASDIGIGYFAQHQLEKLEGSMTPLQHLQQLAPKETTLTLRAFLGRFGLAADSEDRPVMTFSGGEKSRLALALLAWQRPHLLLLDEPTNHLDLDMRDALMLALEEYTGSVILVSHDRSLIRAVADEFWLVADGQVQLFDGDLEDYKNWIENQRVHEAIKFKPEKVTQPKASKLNKKALLSKQAKLEGTLSIAQTELAAIHRQLADPATYTNRAHEEINQLNHIRTELERKIAELEESWLELEAAMEECK
ncbi:ABC-F family ATP-binding cassette domain-containing protein [Nitrosomonas sp. Is37]|uniref:ABC-F family ATP-binding cassette domain-containing protein n=1 Tax=Nitrosomonas sp. Is37 TaxID=3080535 RepID=UPI00294B4B7B|nr:ATP-binding cassette domain-containing protein [Nitrosomonas sp. Is37]MDV6345580.1 ATP-binding cassette domain-containing protein [Nitrosomonas sp. Is37]